MFIVPMSGITPLQGFEPQETTKTVSDGGSFSDIFKQALNNVEETRQQTEEDSIAYALGEIDDLHTIQVNMEKAALALEVFASMKNTAVDSYKEIMGMSI